MVSAGVNTGSVGVSADAAGAAAAVSAGTTADGTSTGFATAATVAAPGPAITSVVPASCETGSTAAAFFFGLFLFFDIF